LHAALLASPPVPAGDTRVNPNRLLPHLSGEYPMKAELIALTFALIPRLVLAGPNAGGILFLHADPSIEYSEGQSDYCGSTLPNCAAAADSVGLSEVHVLFVFAAFPSQSTPRLRGLTFGLAYDPEQVALVAHGKCSDFELATSSWPAAGSGTSVTWTSTQVNLLTEVYWFAGYSYNQTPALFSLAQHPVEGSHFGDDSVPAVLDSISALGTIGFGRSGSLPCPDQPAADGVIKAIYRQ
jgi:hypothetical protein